jgi:hypothetical protein
VRRNRTFLAGALGMSVIATSGLTLDLASTVYADTVIYQNDFESKVGSAFPEWSSSKITYARRGGPRPAPESFLPAPAVTNTEAPRTGRRFLGEFGGPRPDPSARTRVQQTISLTLDHLPPHSAVTVSFDLLILKSWDGDSGPYGPDRWSLRAGDGPALLDATFSNNFKVGSEGSFQSYPAPHSLPQTGSRFVNTLGYRFFGDSIYTLTYAFPHQAGTLVLNFSSDLYEGKGTNDESWGLDNVTVRLKPIDASGATAGTSGGRSSR